MKNKLLILILFFIFTADAQPCKAQVAKPTEWSEIIQRQWYQGVVTGKQAFIYLDLMYPEEGYFFIADRSLPDIYQVIIQEKKQNIRIIKFRMDGKKIKVKYQGTVQNEFIEGLVKTSRKNAGRLAIPTELPVRFVLEKPTTMPVTGRRYATPVFNRADVTEDISYGAASGYYVSMPFDTDSDYDYQQIIFDALDKMYVNPTKQALLHILNNDPVSLILTDLQGLRLDLYQPAGDTLKNRPLILLLHGGAFIMSDKGTGSIRELADNFTRKGYVVAAINYRMGFNPASKSSLERSAYRAVQDSRAALRFLSYNSGNFRIDLDYFFIGGSSAGAITSLNTAFMEEEERPESTRGNFWQFQKDLGGLDESTNMYRNSYIIKAVANLWGAVHDTNLIDRKEHIPVMSFHGDADKIVPFGYGYPFMELDTSITSNIVGKMYGSQYIHRRLTNQGIHSELVVFPGAGHEPQYEAGKYTGVMDSIITRTTGFYLKALFDFPEINGPNLVKAKSILPTYSFTGQDDVTCYWQVEGGKILPGTLKNQAKIVWLAAGTGNISLLLVHKNQANLELDFPVSLPERIANYFPVSRK